MSNVSRGSFNHTALCKLTGYLRKVNFPKHSQLRRRLVLQYPTIPTVYDMTSASFPLSFTTLVYKRLDAGESFIDVNLDIYPPMADTLPKDVPVPTVPTVVFFHGGGLAVGSRQSWFPTWLYSQ